MPPNPISLQFYIFPDQLQKAESVEMNLVYRKNITIATFQSQKQTQT